MSLKSFSRLLTSTKKHCSVETLELTNRSYLSKVYKHQCICDPIQVPQVRHYTFFVNNKQRGLSGFWTLFNQQSRMKEQSTFESVFTNSCINPGTLVSRYASQGKHRIPKIPPSKIMRHYDIHGSISNDDSAKQFVYALSSNERKLLLTELDKYRDVEERRSDATKPSSRQLKQVFLHQALPFIGFGFLDNLLMIVAGEYIDTYLGAAFGISTMAAAAFGNLISDVGGIGSASSVESAVSRCGVRAPRLSPEQVDMGSTKWASNMGKVIGVTIGCLLGMFPLLFFVKDKGDESDNKKGNS